MVWLNNWNDACKTRNCVIDPDNISVVEDERARKCVHNFDYNSSVFLTYIDFHDKLSFMIQPNAIFFNFYWYV